MQGQQDWSAKTVRQYWLHPAPPSARKYSNMTAAEKQDLKVLGKLLKARKNAVKRWQTKYSQGKFMDMETRDAKEATKGRKDHQGKGRTVIDYQRAYGAVGVG